jgi:hypothetical protein
VQFLWSSARNFYGTVLIACFRFLCGANETESQQTMHYTIRCCAVKSLVSCEAVRKIIAEVEAAFRSM